jgi:hypothetical protein
MKYLKLMEPLVWKRSCFVQELSQLRKERARGCDTLLQGLRV